MGLIALIATLTIAARSVNYMVQSTVPPLARELGFTPSSIGLLAALGAAAELWGYGAMWLLLAPLVAAMSAAFFSLFGKTKEFKSPI